MNKTETELLEEIFGSKIWDDMTEEEKYDHVMKESREVYEKTKDFDPYAFHNAVEIVIRRLDNNNLSNLQNDISKRIDYYNEKYQELTKKNKHNIASMAWNKAQTMKEAMRHITKYTTNNE